MIVDLRVRARVYMCVCSEKAARRRRRRKRVDGYCDISISRENFSPEHFIIIKPRPLPTAAVAAEYNRYINELIQRRVYDYFNMHRCIVNR